MREAARDKGRLQDILTAAANIAKFVDGRCCDDFLDDKLLYYAVLKNVEIIGEAAYMLTLEFKELHPGIPWSQIIRMRHILVHNYSSVLPEILWETATKDISELKSKIEELLKDQN